MVYQELRNVAVSLIHALRTRQFYMRLSRQSFPLKVAKALARASRKPCKQPVYPSKMKRFTKQKPTAFCIAITFLMS